MTDNMQLIDELALYDADSGRTLFSDDGERYVIPLYQRAYAWTDPEIEQLIDDILEHEGDRYYLGSIIVSRNGQNYEVIDGQQRLTTLLLLLTELELDVKNILSFACRKQADDTLAKFIDEKVMADEELEPNLLRGRRIIQEKLSLQNRKALLERLAEVRLYRIEVPPHTDLNRYFEIMNTRGEQLEQHDILKARLMSWLQDQNAKELFAQVWTACSDMSGYVQMHFDGPTRKKLFGSDWSGKPSFDQGLHGAGATDEKDETSSCSGDAAWDLETILATGSDAGYIDDGLDRDEKVRFESIVDFPHFLLHVLSLFVGAHDELQAGTDIPGLLDDKKLLKTFEAVMEQIGQKEDAREKFAADFIDFLLRCRFLFDKYMIKREFANDSADGKWSLKELQIEKGRKKSCCYKDTAFNGRYERKDSYEGRHKEILMLQAALRVSYTSPKAMHWITEVLKWLYRHEGAEENPSTDWASYLRATERIAAQAVRENFLVAGNRHMGVNTPHIVLNYLDFLLWRQNRAKYKDFAFEFRNSIEHWYPRHPSEGTFETWSEEDVDDIGNLCIIQRHVNSRFSNLAPAAKKDHFSGMIEKGSLKLRQMAQRTGSNEQWRSESKQLGDEMLALLRDACGTAAAPESSI